VAFFVCSLPEASGSSKMRLSLLLSLVTAALVAGAVACAVMTFWVVMRSAAIEDRIALPHASYSEHQALRSNLYQLFKEKADALLIGDRDGSALENEVKARIEANLLEIQRIIAREIEIDGEKELEELQLLSTLDRNIKEIVQRYEQLLQDLDSPNASGRATLVELLDRDIDQTLSDMIEVALAGEREEVSEALDGAARFRQLVVGLAAAVLGAMMVTTLSC
jgi:two-component system, OmpR family, sensor kinase